MTASRERSAASAPGNWEPRYLVYPNAVSLPEVLTSLARVRSGDDFVVSYLSELPTLLRVLMRKLRDRAIKQD